MPGQEESHVTSPNGPFSSASTRGAVRRRDRLPAGRGRPARSGRRPGRRALRRRPAARPLRLLRTALPRVRRRTPRAGVGPAPARASAPRWRTVSSRRCGATPRWTSEPGRGAGRAPRGAGPGHRRLVVPPGPGELRHLREYAAQRSLYHLKEADPHAWVLPAAAAAGPRRAWRRSSTTSSAAGRADRVHAQLFADLMTDLGLDTAYGRYLDEGRAPHAGPGEPDVAVRPAPRPARSAGGPLRRGRDHLLPRAHGASPTP